MLRVCTTYCFSMATVNIAWLVDVLTNIPICAEGSTSVLVKSTEHK